MKASARHSNLNLLPKTLSYNHQKKAIRKSTDNRHVFGAMKKIMNEDTIASISGNEFFDGNLETSDKLFKCQHVILNGPKYYIGGQPVCWVNQYPDVTRIPRDYTRRPHSGIVP